MTRIWILNLLEILINHLKKVYGLVGGQMVKEDMRERMLMARNLDFGTNGIKRI